MKWSQEAEQLLERAPREHRGTLRLLTHRLALEQGHSVITASLLSDALAVLRPSPEETQEMSDAAAVVAADVLRRDGGTVYLCPRCAHAVRRSRPATCPVCLTDGERFLAVEPEALEAAARSQGGVEEAPAFDGRGIRWSQAALLALDRVGDAYQRSRGRLLVEKAARLGKVPVITLEFAQGHLTEGQPPEASAAEDGE